VNLNSNIKNICFINHFNSEEFIGECLSSVFSQSTPFDQVLIVDDGSTDHSVQIIQEFSEKHQNLRLVTKDNEGQLSTFNTAASYLPDEGQIFLLDGDDIYPDDYLEELSKAIGEPLWDFAYCARQVFNSKDSAPRLAKLNGLPCHFFPPTSALVRSRGCYIGEMTTCISLSAKLFKKIFPCPIDPNQKYWADDHLIYVAGLLGAKKIYVPSICAGWRDHSNNTIKKPYSENDVILREKAISQALNWYCEKYSIPRYPRVSEFFREYDLLGPSWQKKLNFPNKYKLLNRLLRNLLMQHFSKKLKTVRQIFSKGQ